MSLISAGSISLDSTFNVMFIKGARWLWAFHERTLSLKFLNIILRVLRLEVSVYNVYNTNQFQATFTQGGGGVKSVSRDDRE